MKITITKVLVLWGFITCLTFQTQAQEAPKLASPLQTCDCILGTISIQDFADPAPLNGLFFLEYKCYNSNLLKGK